MKYQERGERKKGRKKRRIEEEEEEEGRKEDRVFYLTCVQVITIK